MPALNRRALLLSGAGVAAGGLALPLLAAPPAAAHGGGTTFDDQVRDQGGQVLNVIAFGVKGDTVRATLAGTITAGSTTFTQSANGNNTSGKPPAPIAFNAATDLGKVVTVQGAGSGGSVLSTRITAVIDAKTVTLADAAPNGVTNADFSYGTDDTGAILGAIAAAGDTGTLLFPGGIYTILGASNGGAPIRYAGRGGIVGRGGTNVPNAGYGYRDPNTVILSGDHGAGLVLTGCARYESFMCDGNFIGSAPIQLGTVDGGQVVDGLSHATFVDVWAQGATGHGWSIFGAESCSFYSCGTRDNNADGLLIDGGASGLDFFHLEEYGNNRYGIHGDHTIRSAGGTIEPSTGIRFYSGLCDGAGTLRKTVSKVYLRGAIDWGFPEMIMVASNFGPTVDLDQSSGHSLDFTDSRIIGGGQDGTGNDVCIQISGTPPDDAELTFLKVGGAKFTQAVNNISVLGDPRGYRYSGLDGWWDSSSAGHAAAPGLRAIDTMFTGRTGDWKTATVAAPWTGTVTYRVMGERWVQLAGTAQHAGSGSGPIFALPLGYRPDSDHRQPVSTSAGPGLLVVTTTGDVSVTPLGAATFPANTTAPLDGVGFPVGR